ncbi:MAG: hypothetical protein DRG82_17380 [Deltaproteobacteria bacterium]|nr:MAG: hypothetical protein DRG82_17380 [Deltaproteobacteria bacterium]
MIAQAKELGDIPDTVVKDLTHYTKDPETILTHRAQVSRVILALQKIIGKERAAEYRQRHIQQRKALEQKSLQRKIASAKRRIK